MHPHYLVPVFSTQWFAGILFSFIVYYFILRFGNYFSSKGLEPRFRLFLAGIFIIREIFLYAYIIREGQFTWQDSLPLHLCTISYIFSVIFLIKPNYFLFEFLIMLSLAGAFQSFITPELTHGYSLYFIIDYYFSHGGIIFVPLYGLLILKMKPRTGSWFRVFLFGNVILFCVFVINLILDSNYIYLMEAPIADNPMVWRPYPWHIVGFQFFGTIHILFIYWITRRWKFTN